MRLTVRFFHVVCLALFLFASAAMAAEQKKRSWQVEDDGLQGATEVPGYTLDDMRKLAEAVEKTGLKMGEIPAIIKPVFLSISDASLSMDDDEEVFIVEHGQNLVRIYPRNVLVWHETVNDTVPKTPLQDGGDVQPASGEDADEGYTVSYSPLSGTLVAFRGTIGKYSSLFGSTGTLLNGNSVLFDFISHSMWSQLLAGCFEGPFRGKRLDRVQVTRAVWGGVKERYGGLDTRFSGKAEVLSRATGHRRTYGRDPYGQPDDPKGYYNNTLIPFSVAVQDDRLPPKKRILGLEFDGEQAAVQVDEIKRQVVINFELGRRPLVALYDREIDAVRVFGRMVEGQDAPLTFSVVDGTLIDTPTGTEWSFTGRGERGLLREKQLIEALAIDSMWFAWVAFYRGTRVIPLPQ
ncbi:DUF3179 domain-containing protein [Desulfovibrio sp. OttesenSCG-928-G15]|nr:DUF3179 domain-containing protein [Desulfovibrio sp. OttesenSCG-928-G15]